MVLFQKELCTFNRHGKLVEEGGAAFNGRLMREVGGVSDRGKLAILFWK